MSIKRPQLKLFLALFAAFVVTPVSARAQTTPQPGAPRQVRIMQVDAETLASLDTLAAQTDVGAVSLSVSLEELRSRPVGLKALATWVHEGGLVFLHTDAAQVFGFTTVAPRQATARVGGQLFGKARSALPFAGHPMLWGAPATLTRVPGATAAAASAAPANVTPGTLGVRRVFYQMLPDDRLVLQHPAGVALLEVTDLVLPSTTPLYSAAIAPYGTGWAVFTPTLVEQHRADGAVFVQNLLRLMGSSVKVVGRSNPNGSASMLASLPASFIDSASDRLRQGQNVDAAAIGRELAIAARPTATTLVADPAGVEIPAYDTVARLMVTQGEVTMLSGLLGASATNAAAQPRAAALLYLLRARLELQRQSLTLAETWISLAEQWAADTAETALWRGVLLAARAENRTLDSAARASLLNSAAMRWTQAVGLPADTGDGDEDVPTPGQVASGPSISGIPVSTIRLWNTAAVASARLAAAEPPAVIEVGDTENSVLLRHFPADSTLRLALPAAQSQARSGDTLGWQVPDEEILIFPTVEYYEGYRRASGIASLNPVNPLTRYGDAGGNKILMVSLVSIPVILPATPTRPRRIFQLGTATPAILARLHAHVLIDAIAGGGTFVPEWMQLGLVSLSNIQVQSDVLDTNVSTVGLAADAAANNLLTPAQYRGVATRTINLDLPEAQAAYLMNYFYTRFGAGMVVETLQRLGSGATIDDALDATTGLTEEEFFQAWYDAEFGNRR